MKQLLVALAFLTFLVQADAQQDNRIESDHLGNPPISDRVEEILLTAPELRAKIASFHNDELTRSVDAQHYELKWQRRLSLRDADYILCLFDSSGHSQPGNNPRVLILFTPNYQLKTWGAFTCEPFFDNGYIISRLERLDTYFVTINPASRFGGTLFFEKYVIATDGIRKLGEGYDLTKIPDVQ